VTPSAVTAPPTGLVVNASSPSGVSSGRRWRTSASHAACAACAVEFVHSRRGHIAAHALQRRAHLRRVGAEDGGEEVAGVAGQEGALGVGVEQRVTVRAPRRAKGIARQHVLKWL
jgi:hypothetical protein